MNLIGKIQFPDNNYDCVLLIKDDLEMQIFLPENEHLSLKKHLSSNGIDLNFSIKTEYSGWLIEIPNIKWKIATLPHDYNGIKEILKDVIIDWGIFQDECENLLWLEWTVYPEYVRFIQKEYLNIIPDQWGITYYPQKSPGRFIKYFKNDRNPLGLPRMLYGVDESIYFNNNNKWNIEDTSKRLKLITSVLSLFVGNPLTYQMLIGRTERKIICFQFNVILDKQKHFNADLPNAYVGLKDEYLDEFSEKFPAKIDELFNDQKIDKIFIIFSYYRNLLTVYYEESKMAFSYQILESLARYCNEELQTESLKRKIIKKIISKHNQDICNNCLAVLEKEITEPKKHSEIINKIKRAMLSFREDVENEDIEAILSVSKFYRNQIFHGDFLEANENILKKKVRFQSKWKAPLPLIMQSIVYLMGAETLMHIDYEKMIVFRKG